MQSQKTPVGEVLRSASRDDLKVAETREYRLATGEGRRIVVIEKA
jgi:hypothetical protein